ncbi:unnamed protein product, partial [marine sediment metagenome]
LFSYFLVKDETKKTFIHNQLKEQEFYADLDDKFEEINMNLRAG